MPIDPRISAIIAQSQAVLDRDKEEKRLRRMRAGQMKELARRMKTGKTVSLDLLSIMPPVLQATSLGLSPHLVLSLPLLDPQRPGSGR